MTEPPKPTFFVKKYGSMYGLYHSSKPNTAITHSMKVNELEAEAAEFNLRAERIKRRLEREAAGRALNGKGPKL